MPSVLVELGFLTNEKEAALLADNSYLQKAALGIYNGMSAFVTHFERSRGFTGTK
jgi:N-acetylmuramoyl-L-alanine amidase